MSIYEQASTFTLDENMKKILIQCSKNKWPQQFKQTKGKIYTTTGNIYEIPPDPMDLCNLVHDIIHGIDKPIVSVPTTRQSKTGSITDDAIYSFARRECDRLHKDDNHMEKLASCIFTGIFLGALVPSDFKMDGSVIVGVNKVDTCVPCISDKKTKDQS